MASIISVSNSLNLYIQEKTNGVTRRWSTGTSNKKEAYRILLEYEKRTKRHSSGKWNIKDLRERVLEYVKLNRKHQTYLIYKTMFRHLSRITADNTPLDIFNLKDIEKYKSLRLKEVLPVSINIELRTMRSAFNFALEWNMIPVSISKQVKQLEVDNNRDKILSMDQIKAILSACDSQDVKDVIMVALYTGSRRGEVMALRFKDIDMIGGIIRLYQEKTGKKKEIPMNKELIPIFIRKMGEVGQSMDDKLFNITANWVTHKFKKILRKLGYSEDLRFHSLRHSFATYLLQSGVPLIKVSMLLGHASIGITANTYSHLVTEDLRDAVDRIRLG